MIGLFMDVLFEPGAHGSTEPQIGGFRLEVEVEGSVVLFCVSSTDSTSEMKPWLGDLQWVI
jgi:hypothetical protein